MNATLISLADEVLRGDAQLETPPKNARETLPDSSLPDSSLRETSLLHLALIIGGCGAFYGACMGSFGGAKWDQILYSALKVPLLLGVTFAFALPTFWMLNTLSGLRDEFLVCLRALAAAQAGQAIVLASLAPFTLLFYASFANYQNAILWNVAMFAFAAASAQHLLKIYYRPLIRRDVRHRKLLFGWLFLTGFIGLQSAWMLRPFVGNPEKPTAFIRTEGWSNAYEVLAGLVAGALR